MVSIGREMTYVDGLIGELLVSGGERVNQLEPVDLADLVQIVWKRYEGQSIDLEIDLRHTGRLLVDRSKVLRILIGNAVEAVAGEPKRIWIVSEDVFAEPRVFARVVVGNAGSYISESEHAQLFTKGYTRGKEKGSGLGLAICQEFIAAHGGRVWCESSLEKGTEFIFTLPVVH